jgi:molecular chaperone GrpE (heat shock protein)
MTKESRKLDFKQKVAKEFPEFVSVVDGMSLEELDQRLLSLAKHQEEVAEALAQHEEINRLKEQLKELKADFTDTQKALKMKMKYIHQLMKEKGGA